MTEADKKMAEALLKAAGIFMPQGLLAPKNCGDLAACGRRLVAEELAERVVESENELIDAIADNLSDAADCDVAWNTYASAAMDAIRPILATLAAKLEAAEKRAQEAEGRLKKIALYVWPDDLAALPEDSQLLKAIMAVTGLACPVHAKSVLKEQPHD